MIITNLLTNMVVLALHGEVPTNTPAFQKYAFDTLLTNSKTIATQWGLDLSLLTEKNVTSFEATPFPRGPTATIAFGYRYRFGTRDGDFLSFSDEVYYEPVVFSFTSRFFVNATNEAEASRAYDAWVNANEQDLKRHKAIAEQWARTTNNLTLRKARQIAESALKSAGVAMEDLGFKAPSKGEQMKWSDDYIREIRSDLDIPDTGRGTANITPLSGDRWFVVRPNPHPVQYVLPYYTFRWESKGRGSPNRPWAACGVHVSGITSNIVHFSYYGPGLRLTVPTNYLQILGLPPNAVFVKKRYTTPPTYEVSHP